MSGGAGYVLSREAVRRMVEDGLKDRTLCRSDAGGAEDVEIGRCLEHLDVKAGDSRDKEGRKRFFPFVPEHHLIPGNDGLHMYISLKTKNIFRSHTQGQLVLEVPVL